MGLSVFNKKYKLILKKTLLKVSVCVESTFGAAKKMAKMAVVF